MDKQDIDYLQRVCIAAESHLIESIMSALTLFISAFFVGIYCVIADTIDFKIVAALMFPLVFIPFMNAIILVLKLIRKDKILDL